MTDPRVRLVLNPRAGSRSAARHFPDIQQAFQHMDLSCEVARTAGPGDATRLACHAFEDGVDVIAVAGGDGTLNEVLQAYLGPDGMPRQGPDLAVIPIGTGGDFKRTLGLSGEIHEAVDERIRSAPRRRIDFGLLRLFDFAGSPITRAFLNVASFGMGGITDRIVNSAPKFVGGKLAFFLGTARALLSYRNARVRVVVDGTELLHGPIFNVAVANGRFFGGGMQIAPNADLADGAFDIVAMGDLSRLQVLSLSTKIYNGHHLGHPKIVTARAKTIEAVADRGQDVFVDMDGETPGKLPVHVTICEGSVTVRA